MDAAHRWTDEEIARLERRMAREYGTAVREMRGKLDDFLKEYASELEQRERALDDTPEARKELDAWKRDRAADRRWMQDMVDSLSADLQQAQARAMALVEDRLPRIYCENADFAAFEVDRAARLDTAFNLMDEDTARQLMGRGELLFEPPRPDAAKVAAWTDRKVTGAVTQGILQGESVPRIAQRVAEVAGMSRRAAVRTARTACTGAENAGRVSSYQRAQRLGISLRQEWLATLDMRTRDSHRLLDGERVEVGDKFGNGLRFPGDPQGRPEEVYNCRCTLVAAVDGVDQSAAARFDRLPEGMTYEEWREQARRRMEGEQVGDPGVVRVPDRQVVEGRDILGTWQHRPDQFDFEIEDVLDAQGFDGLPRVVDADEFDQAVRAANGGDGLIMQRSYSAPTREVLDSYRDMLYDGKWYVDCSTGGAQYGQGMYCAADYSGRITSGMREEMVHYHKLNAEKLGGVMTTEEYKLGLIEDYVGRMAGTAEERDATRAYLRTKARVGEVTADERRAAGKILSRDSMRVLDTQADIIAQAREGSFTYVETMTLDPSARIVKFDDISGLKDGMGDRIFLESVKDASQDEILIIKKEITHTATDEEWGAAKDLEDRIGLQEARRIVDKYKGAYRDAMDAADKYRGMDNGSFAAAMGYDAINAEGHGASGSYTVVLNRTKLIIRRP